MPTLIQDLRYALRQFSRGPGFTATIILTAAVGIGAAGTISSVVNALFLRPLPGVAHQERLVNVHGLSPDRDELRGFSYPAYRDLADRSGSFSGLAAFEDRAMSVRVDGEPQLVVGQLVSGNYFDVLGVRPTLGRMFEPTPSAEEGPVVVLSHRLWLRHFGADDPAVGRSIRLNGHPFTVVGVAPPHFVGTFLGFPFDTWVPLEHAHLIAPELDLERRDRDWLEVVARLAPGVQLHEARERATGLVRALSEQGVGEWRGRSLALSPTTGLDDSLREGLTVLVGLLAALAALVLIMAGVNVAGMLLIRGASRARELAVRTALGAGRRRIVRQLTVETLVPCAVGGALGAALAVAATGLLERFDPPLPVSLALDLAPDARVLAFTILLSVAGGLLIGALPALTASRVNAITALRGGTASDGSARLRSGLVMAQVAAAVLVLATAGLFTRALLRARTIDPGFDARGLVVTDVPYTILDRSPERGRSFYRQIIDRISALPGIDGAAAAMRLPLGLGASTATVQLPDHSGDSLTVDANIVTPAYFETLRIPILAGRAFDERDREDAHRVAILNETLAGRLWPGGPAVGRDLVVDGDRVRVVGVARTGKYRSLSESPRGHVYRPLDQRYHGRMDLILRSARPAPHLAEAVRRAVLAIEPDLPLPTLIPVPEHLRLGLLPQRVAATVGAILGGIALILAGVGLYAVVGYSVVRRRREMGVRTALGARPGNIHRLVTAHVVRLLVAGSVLGIAVTVWATRILASLLLNVPPHDPGTLAAVVALLAATGAAAAYFPARRAASVDPMEALRHE